MARLEQITAETAGRYLLKFRRSDGSVIEVTVIQGAGPAITAQPDLLAVGKWRDVNDIAAFITPAVQAFASATMAEIDDQ